MNQEIRPLTLTHHNPSNATVPSVVVVDGGESINPLASPSSQLSRARRPFSASPAPKLTTRERDRATPLDAHTAPVPRPSLHTPGFRIPEMCELASAAGPSDRSPPHGIPETCESAYAAGSSQRSARLRIKTCKSAHTVVQSRGELGKTSLDFNEALSRMPEASQSAMDDDDTLLETERGRDASSLAATGRGDWRSGANAVTATRREGWGRDACSSAATERGLGRDTDSLEATGRGRWASRVAATGRGQLGRGPSSLAATEGEVWGNNPGSLRAKGWAREANSLDAMERGGWGRDVHSRVGTGRRDWGRGLTATVMGAAGCSTTRETKSPKSPRELVHEEHSEELMKRVVKAFTRNFRRLDSGGYRFNQDQKRGGDMVLEQSSLFGLVREFVDALFRLREKGGNGVGEEQEESEKEEKSVGLQNEIQMLKKENERLRKENEDVERLRRENESLEKRKKKLEIENRDILLREEKAQTRAKEANHSRKKTEGEKRHLEEKARELKILCDSAIDTYEKVQKLAPTEEEVMESKSSQKIAELKDHNLKSSECQ
eukprot:1365346-Amorphochlora_amoeboformis.AAC.1